MIKIKTEAKKKKAAINLTGKMVLWNPKHPNSQAIAGIVRSQSGKTVEVDLAVPNSEGLLVVARGATVTLHREDVAQFGGVYQDGRDVKLWESNQPISDVKQATEVKRDNVVVDYRGVSFEGFGSTFGSVTNRDRDQDYVMPGAFDKSIRRFKENPVMLINHTRQVISLMGHYSKLSVVQTGLAVRGEVTDSPHPDAVHTRFQIVEGSLKTLSIGGIFFYAEDFKGIKEVDLHEVSLVVIPANPDATVQVRSLSESIAESIFREHAKRFGGEVRHKNS